MKSYTSIITNFLEETKGLKKTSDGPALGGKTEGVTIEQKDALMKSLEQRSSQAGTILWVVVIMYIVLFVIAIWVVINSINDTKLVTSLLSGLFFGSSGILFGLNKLWKDKTKSDFTRYGLVVLPPNEVQKVLLSYYSEEKK